jgi:hypothetical protein
MSDLSSLCAPKQTSKANLAPYRVLHFVVLAFVAMRFLPGNWPGLEWTIFKQVIKCGEQSLAVFCAEVFLAFVGRLVLMTNSKSLLAQILVSVSGIAAMTLVAYYISWSKQQDAWRRVHVLE